MLDDITELRTFVRIAAAGSLSAASREMGLALSVVSKRLASLERRAEVRLIARSTRSLALTEEGQRLFERAQRILSEVDEAEAALRRGRVEPEGVLRVSAPHALGRAHVSPVCRDLVRTYPQDLGRPHSHRSFRGADRRADGRCCSDRRSESLSGNIMQDCIAFAA